MSDIAEQVLDIDRQIDNLTDLDNGQAQFSIAKAQYDKWDTRTQTTGTRQSTLTAGNNVELNAAGDIDIQGSDLIADAAQGCANAVGAGCAGVAMHVDVRYVAGAGCAGATKAV